MPRFRLLHTAIFTLSVLGLPVPVLAQDADLPDNTVTSESGEAEQAPEDAGLQQDGGGGDTSSDDGLTAGRADHSADDTETAAGPNEDLPVNASAVANQDKCYESFTYANALMRAENAYVRRRYTTVIEILLPIYENIQCVDDANGVIELELLLGVAYFEEGDTSRADSFFLNVLRTEPDHIVGSVITLPDSSARRIETLRSEHAEELDQLRSQKAPNTVIESLYVLTEKEEHPYWLNFLPFGVGVFQMHQTSWGIVYASVQSAGILMSILGGGMVEYYRGENYTFTPRNYTHAKHWQTLQIIGISLLGAGYVASVIHALVIHEDSTLIIHSPTQTRPDISNLSPFILPDGAGIAYGGWF